MTVRDRHSPLLLGGDWEEIGSAVVRVRPPVLNTVPACGCEAAEHTDAAHDLDDAARIADHWVILEHGRIAAANTPRAIMRQPQSSAVGQHAILGHRVTPPMKDGINQTTGAGAVRSSDYFPPRRRPRNEETATIARRSR